MTHKAILVNGTVGKTCTLFYLKYFLEKVYHIKCLLLNFHSDKNLKSIHYGETIKTFDDGFIIDLKFISDIMEENKLDLIISKSTSLDDFLDIVVSGLTYLDSKMQIVGMSSKFITEGKVLITCNQNKMILDKLIQSSRDEKVELIMVDHFHLSFINHPIGSNAKYNYMNFSLAFALADFYLSKMFNFEFQVSGITKTKDFKTAILGKIPKIEKLDLGFYSFKHIQFTNFEITFDASYTKNACYDFLDFAFSKNPKGRKILIFDPNPLTNVIGNIVSIFSYEFDLIIIPHYDRKGPNSETLFNNYFEEDLVQNFEYNWEESIRDVFRVLDAEKFGFSTGVKTKNFKIVKFGTISSIETFFQKIPTDKKNTVICMGTKTLIDDIQKMIPNF